MAITSKLFLVSWILLNIEPPTQPFAIANNDGIADQTHYVVSLELAQHSRDRLERYK